MSDSSPILSLPYIQDGQAQKHVTHNEGMRVLDAIAQIGVTSASLTQPPAAADGDRYLVASGGEFEWAGHDAEIAVWVDAGWQFFAPQAGWLAWDAENGSLLVFDGSIWSPATDANVSFQNLPELGVNATADSTNRLSISSAATLLNHEGNGHQLKINKNAAGDTGSLLFQTNWSGRAEMGIAGSDDFSIKTSADGSTFNTALEVNHSTGKVSFPSGASGLAPIEFGAGPLVTTDLLLARGVDLVTNGTGYLGNAHNFPAQVVFDGTQTPNLPGAMRFEGHYAGAAVMQEVVPVDPNRIYRLSCYFRQESAPGDWSAFTHGDRHAQYFGVICFDADGNQIESQHHMRFKTGPVDSLTTLAADLTPGDTSISLTDASGWNDAASSMYQRGVAVFGYKNTLGSTYKDYTRYVQYDLFDLSGVNKSTNTITLKTPFPASLGNPDHPSGTWPAGTRIANSDAGGTFKYAGFNGLVPASSDTWYLAENHIGGIDRSGRNESNNFAPGTASAKLMWLLNYSNRPGGYSIYADTGASHKFWVSGVSVLAEPLATLVPVTTGANAGSFDLRIPRANAAGTAIDLSPASLKVTDL